MNHTPRVTLVTTVLNEESSIESFISTMLRQSRPPDEIIVVDGGSSDATMEIIAKHSGPSFRVIQEIGANISRGRNLAIGAARHPIIACTDAGTRLAPDWLANLVAPFASAQPPDVVCGFFEPDPQTTLEKTMGATVLPEWGEIEPATFLPSSRSVAYTKIAWEKVGGYPEWLDYCEDIVFDLRLHQAGLRFGYAPAAIAYFRPRPSLSSFYRQYYRYARGDGKAGLWRNRHVTRYVTYLVGPIVAAAGFWYNWAWAALLLAMIAYCWGPYRRLGRWLKDMPWHQKALAVALVPIIRLVGDIAKMVGYPAGILWRRKNSPPNWNNNGA